MKKMEEVEKRILKEGEVSSRLVNWVQDPVKKTQRELRRSRVEEELSELVVWISRVAQWKPDVQSSQ